MGLECSGSSLVPLFPSPTAVVPNIFGIRDQFRGRQFFHGLRRGVWGQEVELRR